MASYVLIESRDPFESNDVRYFYDLAASLARADNHVTLFLVQNGVLAARAGDGAHGSTFPELSKAGVRVLADDFSLRERGIAKERITDGVKPAGIEAVVDQLGLGAHALWH